ncbi:hypothetical protein QBC41DRAFT_311055 [Cercophora samala]|uniref:Uncharacterized protein n=1 Tax=Cercophora samala TaxID=330535 RepID=A0AA39ZLX9_9PEZI|nr:hypothetical protein QBC41DRAFT_311055 [Cercophora samala]
MSSNAAASLGNSLEENIPPWGSLPVEQYILQKWDGNSSQSVEDQRDALVKAFINEDVINPEYQTMTHVPTRQEITTILQPWRPQKIRAIAAKHLSFAKPCPDFEKEGFHVLRTWYHGGKDDDEKLEKWLGYDELKGLSEGEVEERFLQRQPGSKMRMQPKSRWWMVLDDKEVFDVEDEDNDDDWLAVYKVLPELAAPLMKRELSMFDILDSLRVSGTPYPRRTEPSQEQYEDAILEASSGYLRYPLVILDQEAFETDQMYLVWRDHRGNVVKDIRADISGLPVLQAELPRNPAYDIKLWVEACFGRQYNIHGKKGKVMRKMLPLVKEATAETMAHNVACGF